MQEERKNEIEHIAKKFEKGSPFRTLLFGILAANELKKIEEYVNGCQEVLKQVASEKWNDMKKTK